MWKVGGAKAAQGADLDVVAAAARKAIDHTRSIGAGLGPCTIPANGKPNFQIADGTVEFGIGHHGEPGIRVEKLQSAAGMAEEMTGLLLDELSFRKEKKRQYLFQDWERCLSWSSIFFMMRCMNS